MILDLGASCIEAIASERGTRNFTSTKTILASQLATISIFLGGQAHPPIQHPLYFQTQQDDCQRFSGNAPRSFQSRRLLFTGVNVAR